jgi:PAS domain S-box-containing protein
VRYEASFLERIVEWVAHPIFVKDRDFRYVLVNRALCDMTGHPQEAMIGKTDYDLFAKDEADFFRKKDVELFSTRRAVDILEEPITDARGERHTLATTKVPLLDEVGEVTYLVGIIHDITRLKAAEDALRRANEELEKRVTERTHELDAVQQDLMRKERLAVLGQLAGGVAHQIRNPLAAIKNAAYVIERITKIRVDDEAERQALGDALAVIHDEIDGANQTITALLDYARVRHAHRRPTCMADLVEAALASLSVPPTVKVVSEIPEWLPMVGADAEQARSAIANIIQNAIEAMPEGGTISILAGRDERAVELSIVDSGPGVAPAVRARLFEPLVTTKPLGLGLGLVTARTLLAGQGGELRYVDGGAAGATFRLRLPIANLTPP